MATMIASIDWESRVGLNVAITGMGVISALGHTPSELFARLAKDESAIQQAPWTREDPERTEFWAPIRNFDPAAWFDERLLEGTAAFAQQAVAASDLAMQDAGIETADALRTGIVVGTSKNGTQTMERAQFDADRHGRDGVSKKIMIQVWPNMAAGQIAMRWGLHGPCLTVTNACASGLDAIGLAARLIQGGLADVVLAGATEGGLATGIDGDGFIPASAYGRAAYGMGAPTTDPLRACLPFDEHRAGMVFGEGTAMFVLERPDHARARGARVHGYVEGWGTAADAFHPSAPEPSGAWERRVMELALDEAGVAPTDIDVVAAHATGTPKGDIAEIRALNGVFGGQATSPLVASNKGLLGHPTGSAGALALAVTLVGMHEGRAIHTGATTVPDPELEVDVVIGEPRDRDAEWALANAFGFGGQNAALVVRAGGGAVPA